MSETAAPVGISLTTHDKFPWPLLVLAGISGMCFCLGVSTGAVPISLLAWLSGEASELETTVLYQLRLPRVVLAGACGALLGIAGSALQGLFRNPLADPGLIGVSSGAALGAISMIVLGERLSLPASVVPYSVPLAAVAGALAVTAFLYLFSRRFGHFSIVTILLVGIAINALSTVGIGAFEYLSDDRQLRTLIFWMMGSFGRVEWQTLIPALAIMSLAFVVLTWTARDMDRLQLGEDAARHLGVNTTRLKQRVIFACAAGVGAAVALSGIIGFVGLVVPHLVRLLIGPTHGALYPGAAFLGAGLLILADLVARLVVIPAELPVSLVTSAIGAPFFLWLITRIRAR